MRQLYKSIQGLSNPIPNTDLRRLQQSNNQIEHSTFKDLFKNALENVNQIEKESDIKTQMLASGKDISLHEVMISAQKASITIDATVQIQQKVIDAYNEVMRMQI